MANIQGQVLDDNGFSVKTATVSIDNKIAMTDDRGHFCIENVPAGSFFLIAEHRDYTQFIMPIVVSGDKDVVITMSIDPGIPAVG